MRDPYDHAMEQNYKSALIVQYTSYADAHKYARPDEARRWLKSAVTHAEALAASLRECLREVDGVEKKEAADV